MKTQPEKAKDHGIIWQVSRLNDAGIGYDDALRWAECMEGTNWRLSPENVRKLSERLPVEKAREYLAIRTPNGSKLVGGIDPDLEEISKALTVEQAKEFVTIRSKDNLVIAEKATGHPYSVDGRDVANYLSGNTLAEMKRVAAGCDHNVAVYVIKLGLNEKEAVFQDTERPNAIVCMPTFPYFRSNKTRLIKDIAAVYDVRLVFTEEKQGLYAALKTTPNVDLLLLAAHGEQKDMNFSCLSDAPKAQIAHGSDKNHITPADADFSEYLPLLKPDARICLVSCSTGKGGEGAENMANCFAAWSGRTVYAPKSDVMGTQIVKAVPFTPRFVTEHGADVTYVAKSKPAEEF